MDLHKLDDVNAYERYIEGLVGDEPESEDDIGNGDGKGAPQAAAAPAAPAAAAPVPPATPSDGDHEEGILAPGKLPARLKVPTDDPLSFHTARLFKEGRMNGDSSMTMGKAEVLAKAILGISDETPGSATAAPAASEPTAPTSPTLDILNEALEAATLKFETAGEAFDAKRQGEALREINKLNRQIAQATVDAQRMEAEAVTQQATAQEQFMQEWQATEAQVHGMFSHANAADVNSPLHQKAAEIQAMCRDSQDPAMQAIYNSPKSVLLYFSQAAQELNIMPSGAPAVAAPIQPANKSTPPPVSRHVPVGAALLATPTGGNAAPFQGRSQQLPQSIHELEQLVERMAA